MKGAESARLDHQLNFSCKDQEGDCHILGGYVMAAFMEVGDTDSGGDVGFLWNLRHQWAPRWRCPADS